MINQEWLEKYAAKIADGRQDEAHSDSRLKTLADKKDAERWNVFMDTLKIIEKTRPPPNLALTVTKSMRGEQRAMTKLNQVKRDLERCLESIVECQEPKLWLLRAL
jgi:hypothetical protein